MYDYISVYKARETNFNHNGQRILSPTECTISEELNGAYELTLTHPIDDLGNWEFLVEMNIIKAQGQLFRIYDKVTTMDNTGRYERKVSARHIFYDLNVQILRDKYIVFRNGTDCIADILASTNMPITNFTGTSDITDLKNAHYVEITPISAFLGDENAFINVWGGELYRDNFEFTINKRRGYNDAFRIEYGVEMLEIEETVDYSDFCNTLICKGSTEGLKTTVYSGFYPDGLYHYKIQNFEAEDLPTLTAMGKNWLNQNGFPMINYKVKFANLTKYELYKDFTALQECHLGDTGTIYNEEIGIETQQQITKVTIDGITGETLEIELGVPKNTLTRTIKNIVSKYNTTQQNINNNVTEELHTWDGLNKFNLTWDDMASVKWSELE